MKVIAILTDHRVVVKIVEHVRRRAGGEGGSDPPPDTKACRPELRREPFFDDLPPPGWDGE
ncbi:MAG: hypothetical protein HY815_33265 [Candidatus Riflebacteria bacterium]|nr:hypothetical protein [Candidatus Riflebacteria bacterium]